MAITLCCHPLPALRFRLRDTSALIFLQPVPKGVLLVAAAAAAAAVVVGVMVATVLYYWRRARSFCLLLAILDVPCPGALVRPAAPSPAEKAWCQWPK